MKFYKIHFPWIYSNVINFKMSIKMNDFCNVKFENFFIYFFHVEGGETRSFLKIYKTNSKIIEQNNVIAVIFKFVFSNIHFFFVIKMINDRWKDFLCSQITRITERITGKSGEILLENCVFFARRHLKTNKILPVITLVLFLFVGDAF